MMMMMMGRDAIYALRDAISERGCGWFWIYKNHEKIPGRDLYIQYIYPLDPVDMEREGGGYISLPCIFVYAAHASSWGGGVAWVGIRLGLYCLVSLLFVYPRRIQPIVLLYPTRNSVLLDIHFTQ